MHFKEMKKLIKKLLGLQQPPRVRVFSHARSGTHFLEAFLAHNFYPNEPLKIDEITWGHWCDRRVNTDGNKYGRLFGSHSFPKKGYDPLPKVYIARDGRAVAYSMWKTPNFVHSYMKDFSFQEFLREPIDWYGTPSNKADPKINIIEHWDRHITEWIDYAASNPNTLVIKYEDLVDRPYEQYEKIHSAYFPNKPKLNASEIDNIRKPVGLLPNKAKKDSWKDVFEKEDLDLYFSIVQNKLYKE